MSDESAPSDPLLDFLRDTGAPCPMCRYNLKGVNSTRCPECGYQLRLTIAGPPAGFGWWLAGIFGLACTVLLLWMVLRPSIPRIAESVNNPSLAALVQQGFVAQSDLPNWAIIIPFSVGLLSCLGLIGLIIGYRRRLVTWPSQRQIICGTALMASPLIVLVIIAALT